MSDTLSQRVRAAAAAAWWTVLIGALWLSVGWVFLLWIMAAEPAWLLWLWGGHMTWKEVHDVFLIAYAVAKMVLLAAVLAAVWLTIWGRKLRRLAGG